MISPLEYVRRIGDKLIRETPFEYRLELNRPSTHLDRMHGTSHYRDCETMGELTALHVSTLCGI